MSVELALEAHKALLKDYALRTRQAEELASTLLCEKFSSSHSFIAEVVNKIDQHANSRAAVRCESCHAVLQLAVIALTTAYQTSASADELRASVLAVIQSLTLTR